ncbi:dethiobiotin synthase [Sporosarcina sp. 179-K 3D1 HS]|uniref:dethiobiotin synthase n=1 Tax=Sporosarcina sp. 179-K 3D1 HS TaxID=3232169 RepID=UPI0039A31593
MVVLFVTGTDTDVGKTMVTTLLTSFLENHGHSCFPFKPIQSGAVEKDGDWVAPDPEMYRLVREEEKAEEACLYLLKKACSPHLAADLEGVNIDFSLIQTRMEELEAAYGTVIVEGAGGLFVPLTTEGYCVVDWMEGLGVPAIIVAKAGVGTINHTVLTVEAMRKRKIPIAGVIFNYIHNDEEAVVKDNMEMVRRLADVPIIGTVPYCDNIHETLADAEKRKQYYADWDFELIRGAMGYESATIA